ncbi:hypothetical protein ABT354_01795 [Streptomyces sp. NPDC000594]|uniref:hypothetical protein n=1 Tax=Streptomyces sp. NPDC000594 TaxID=3154261 RepID=UPI00333214EC
MSGTRPLAEVDELSRGTPGDLLEQAPERLRALTAEDAAARAPAWHWLDTHLCHQGAVHPAAVPVVPFLLGLLTDGPTPEPQRLLGFLCGLVEMESEDGGWLPDGLDPERHTRLPVARAVHTALSDGIGAVLPRLADDDPATAGAAAELLAWFPNRAAEILPRLRPFCERARPGPERSTAFIALGLLAGASGDRSDIARLEAVLAAGAGVDRWAAGVALARITAPDIPPAVVETLIAELARIALDPEPYETVRGSRFHRGDVGALITATLRRLPPSREDGALTVVARLLRDGELTPETAAELASGLVVDALGDLDTVPAGELTPWRRAALGALPTAGAAWESGELGPWLTSAYGLPATPDALRDRLRQAP